MAQELFLMENFISLNENYTHYKIIQDSTDCLYTLTFSKDTISITYKFKLQ
jgi:hypothetical protein